MFAPGWAQVWTPGPQPPRPRLEDAEKKAHHGPHGDPGMRVVEGCEGGRATEAKARLEDEEGLEEGAWDSETGGEAEGSGGMRFPDLQC